MNRVTSMNRFFIVKLFNMQDQKKNEGLKLILIKAAKMIVKLNQKSLDIIAKRKMYHTKLIERSSRCTKFRFQPTSVYLTTGCYQLPLDERRNILLPGTCLKIVVDVSNSSLRPFADDVICKNHRMMNRFNIKETIKEMFHFYMRNIDTLLEKNQNKDYIWKNIYVNKFLGASARSISLMARSIISRLFDSAKTNCHYICFLYCFTNLDPRNASYGTLTYCLPDGTIVDMGAEKGIFSYSDEHNSYLLYGMEVARMLRKRGKAELLNGILEGYKMVYPAIEGKNIVSVRFLESNSHNVEEGEANNVYIGGDLYTAVKDSSITCSLRSTVSRYLDDIVKRAEKQGRNIILGKRWQECEELDFEHFGPTSKKKKMEEKNVLIEYTDDIVVGFDSKDFDDADNEIDSNMDV